MNNKIKVLIIGLVAVIAIVIGIIVINSKSKSDGNETTNDDDITTTETTTTTEESNTDTDVETDAEAVVDDFNYNNWYNRRMRVVDEKIFVSEKDGIYVSDSGLEDLELIFENNAFSELRGLEVYKGYLYFCGNRSDETYTVYRMKLSDYSVEDILLDTEFGYPFMWNLSIYDNKLYVTTGLYYKKGFELDSDGLIAGVLDDTSPDFLYYEYNKKENVDSEVICVMDTADSMELLDGKQIVVKKDTSAENLIVYNYDFYIEDVLTKTSEKLHACREVYLVTEEEIIFTEEIGDNRLLRYDLNTKEVTVLYESNYGSSYAFNYDGQNVYFVDCNSMDDCNLLLSVPRKGGEAKTICELNNIASVDKLKANTLLYKDKLYIPDEGLINLK